MSVADSRNSEVNNFSGTQEGGRSAGGSSDEMEHEKRMAAYNRMILMQKTELKQKFTLSMPQ